MMYFYNETKMNVKNIPPSSGRLQPHFTLNSTSRCGESASYYWGALSPHLQHLL